MTLKKRHLSCPITNGDFLRVEAVPSLDFTNTNAHLLPLALEGCPAQSQDLDQWPPVLQNLLGLNSMSWPLVLSPKAPSPLQPPNPPLLVARMPFQNGDLSEYQFEGKRGMTHGDFSREEEGQRQDDLLLVTQIHLIKG